MHRTHRYRAARLRASDRPRQSHERRGACRRCQRAASCHPHRCRVRAERVDLARERLHPRVTHRPGDRNAETESCFDVRVPRTRQYTRRAPRTERRQGRAPLVPNSGSVSCGCRHDAGRLAGNERLKVDDGQQCGFNQLRLRRSRSDAHDRFASEHGFPFTHRPYVAFEAE